MKLDTASAVEQLVWSMRDADWPRAQDRARILQLFNGAPPYSAQEVSENNIAVNVNFLEPTRLSHDARSQLYGAFLKPGRFFACHTDMGVSSRRSERASIVTRETNKRMKGSLNYYECFRSKFASLVLYGIGPSVWDNESTWCPDMIGIEDVLVPARTYLTMKNLPFFALRRSYTAPEIIRLTRGPRVDPAWNLELVDRMIQWIDDETRALMGSSWPEIWSPEKLQERIKGDGGFYTADNVPTIDVFDVYAWDDDGEKSGWERRMVLDAWSAPGAGSNTYTRNTNLDFAKGQWLYNGGRRKFANKFSEVACFQFADLSAGAPFQYHSVRSLGFLLHAVCQLQNRLRCKFNESVFESLMMLFRVKSLDDVERAMKVSLVTRGFLEEGVSFVPAAERFQANAGLVELGLNENSRLINENAQSYRATGMEGDNSRKTKAQVMAELNATTALVQAALMQAYEYQKFEYREIFRRFMRPMSRDPEVRDFRAACLRQKIPEKMLVPEAWELEPERVMGSGNKALELEIAQQLMAYRQLYDPDPQRKILRDVTLAITDDPARASELVPEKQNKVTDSVHDAQLASGSLMQGLPVAVKQGYNHAEYCATLLAAMQTVIQKVTQSGGVGTPDIIIGLHNMASHVQQHLALLAQDKESKPIVKQLGDALGKMMNEVKAFEQRLQAQQQAAAQQNGNGQIDPKDKAKIQAIMMTAKVKSENQAQSHAQRTAQRQIQFELEQKRKAQEDARAFRQRHAEATLDLAKDRTKHLRSISE